MTTTEPTTEPTVESAVESSVESARARATDLALRWDAQQTAYVRHRAERFATIARVVAGVCAGVSEPRILDLAGGTGGLGVAVQQAVPGARVVLADKDPVLLALAADRFAGDPRWTVADVDLDDPAWAQHPALAGEPFDAVVSSTALHWLSPAVLTRVYWALAGLVRPGGVLLNGDHFLYDEAAEPALREIARLDDVAQQEAALAAGAETWDQWWAAAEAVPAYADAAARRAQVWAHDDGAPAKVTAGFHLEALRSAGFTQTGTVWRYLDDHVVYGIR